MIRCEFLVCALTACIALGVATHTASAQCANWVPVPATDSFNAALRRAAVWDPDGTGPMPAGLVVAGEFTSVGSALLRRIGIWNGLTWSQIGAGIGDGDFVSANISVTALAVYRGELIAGGRFVFVNTLGETVVGLTRWDGNAWRPFGGPGGFGASVADLAVSGDRLVAVGFFTSMDGIDAANVAEFDGVAWSALGSGTDRSLSAVEIVGGDTYVGGTITTAGGMPASLVAKWNGTQWSAVGTGLQINSMFFTGTVNGLRWHQGSLYATGYFDRAGATILSHIARWTGTAWVSLGSGLNDIGLELLSTPNGLVVGGGFSSAGGTSASRIARWTGSVFQRLGSGVAGTEFPAVDAVALFNGEVIAGGNFTQAGAQNAGRWGRWSDTGIPWLATPPMNVTVSAGGDASFTVRAATGYTVLEYRWQRNGVPVANGSGGASPGGGTVSGQFTPLLSITSIAPSDGGTYTCVVSTACGGTTSPGALLTVTPTCCVDYFVDGELDFNDIERFLTNLAAQIPGACAPGADLNNDGEFDFSDIERFLVLFAAGC